MPESLELTLPDPAATDALGVALAAALQASTPGPPGSPGSLMVWLHGGLGAGKTSLARAWLAGLGHRGRVPSPTYTLVEPYELAGWSVRHADLYRLASPGDIDDLGLDEPADHPMLCLVEWPERGQGRLPAPDLQVFLELDGGGRWARLLACSAAGQRLVAVLRPIGPPVPYQAKTENDLPSS